MASPPALRCTVCQVRSSGPLCGLAGNALLHLDREAGTQLLKRGQTIFHAGAPARSLYVVRSGRVKVYRAWHDGEEQVLRLLGPGELLGYRALFADEPYGASAEAVRDSVLCVVPRETVHELLRSVPQLALHLLAMLAHELRVSEDLMMDLLRRPVRQRTARLLLGLLASSQGATDASDLPSDQLKRKDMARMVGTTPETFSRVLRAFADTGIVSLSRDRIRVRDQAGLARIAREADPA
jgi:CRP-like cAMP-binding protein